MTGPAQILILEAKETLRAELGAALQGLDASIEFAGGAEQAAASAAGHPPDLVIADISTSETQVSDMLAALRSTVRRGEPALVLVISRPFDPASIRQACTKVLAANSAANDTDLRTMNPANASEWRAFRERLLRAGEERLRADRTRFERLGLVDAAGHPTSSDLPPDMLPQSTTSVIT